MVSMFKSSLTASLRARAALALGAGCLMAALAGCGGSAKQIEPFVPVRVVAFGDENNVILPDGRKYTVNDITGGTVDCTKNVIWVQRLANGLGVPMRECPGTVATNARSFSRGAVGATANDLKLQVDAHVASDTFANNDLVAMYVGLHDILRAYNNVATLGEASATATLQAQGRLFGQQVNRVAVAGPAVLVVTVPNVGEMPFGRAQNAITPGAAELLRRLTSAFNIAMRLEIINDGRLVGLVDAFDLARAATTVPALFSLINVTDAVCSVATPTPDCSTATVIQPGGVPAPVLGYMWADSLHFSPNMQERLGATAEARARNNPF